MNSRIWVTLGAIFSFLCVAFGAFGAHALRSSLSEKALIVYHTAVQYQMFHSLALVGFGLWLAQHPESNAQFPGWAFTGGLILFSGSLYGLALTDLRLLGVVTPFGGVLFLLGWIRFAFLAWRA
jgi:uncharacterized membrane protein YgdD (TMEM256/DUF423 family)